MFERGQVSTYDFFIAMILFLFLFLTLNFVWMQNTVSAEENREQGNIQFRALQAIDSMLKTRGWPPNWELDPAGVKTIGLAEEKGKIDSEKLAAFQSMDYTDSKNALGIADLNYFFEFDANGTADDFNKGNPVPVNVIGLTIQRMVQFKGEKAIVRFNVFREQE